MYPIDTTRFQPRATGIVSPVRVWGDGEDGRRIPTDKQQLSESGVPLWEIEISFKRREYGTDRTANATVLIPAAVEPVVAEYAPVQFDQLTAEFYVSKNQLRQRFAAEGIVSPAPAGRKAE